jgi:hypothetical protein
MGGYIGIMVANMPTIHAASTLCGSDTICGTAADDPGVDHEPCGVPPGAKIDCKECIAIIRECRQFREKDFENGLRL